MKTCQDCEEEVDELEVVKVGGKRLKLCEDCAELRREEMAIAEEAEGAMQGMMEYKGR
jgi:ribosome-binding protein aMBF1 (putative translation factor)